MIARTGLRLVPGDDDGGFAAALKIVRKVGGVIEHPAGSKAWAIHGLNKPSCNYWEAADWDGGWTVQLNQNWFGHPAIKPTWLYAVSRNLPDIIAHRKPETATARIENMSANQREATPRPFAEFLIDLAKGAVA